VTSRPKTRSRPGCAGGERPNVRRLAPVQPTYIAPSAGSGDEGIDDVAACRSRLFLARSYRVVVLGSAWRAAICTSRRDTPASKAAVIKLWRSECGEIRLVIPALWLGAERSGWQRGG
jgi:hypothetical protein